MKTSITSAQAMLHPTVVETINALSELCRELREELETARADEREACAALCFSIWNEWLDTPEEDRYKVLYDAEDYAAAIRARGNT